MYADDALARKLEPGAAAPSARYRAIRTLAERGILTGVIMMPILPFIEDSEENIAEIVRQAHESGASYIIPAFGMTLRDRQRAYYYDKLDKHFPGLRQRYAQAFGNDYFAPVRNYHQLEIHFKDLCSQYEIPTHMAQYQPFSAEQLSLF